MPQDIPNPIEIPHATTTDSESGDNNGLGGIIEIPMLISASTNSTSTDSSSTDNGGDKVDNHNNDNVPGTGGTGNTDDNNKNYDGGGNNNNHDKNPNPGTPTAANSLVKDIFDKVQESYSVAVLIISETIKNLSFAIHSPIGSVMTKILAVAGIVLAGFTAIAGVAFAGPLTFSEMYLIPGRIFGLLLGALGIQKKNRPWGTVYDSVTKRPIDPAYVTLVNKESGKEVASAITDLDGRYSFLVLPGIYTIFARKTNYAFPSSKMSGQSFDDVYNDLYFGTDIVVRNEDEIISKNIPMDSNIQDWNEFTKNRMNINTFVKGNTVLLAKISRLSFVIGLIVSLLALAFAREPYNYIIVLSYIGAFIFNYFVIAKKNPGTLIEKSTGTPISYAMVKIFREGMNDAPLAKKIADKYGKYFTLVPNGNYFLEIDRKNNDESYTEIFKSGILTVDKGVINSDFSI